MNRQKYEWISVSEYAERIGKTTQTVYNMIQRGELESKSFKRQTMNGILVKAPKEKEYNDGERED